MVTIKKLSSIFTQRKRMVTLSAVCLFLYYVLKPRKDSNEHYTPERKQQHVRANIIDDYEHHKVLMDVKEFKELEKQKEYEDKCMLQN